ncbi:MAG: VWA domain-containing protein [Alistipes sp.]|nr:VWA domain-containing protein [Alistipes sp.]
MKRRIYNLIIIDESGSMHAIKQQTIDNINETIQTIRHAEKKHEDQEHFVTVVTFNDDVKTIHDCVAAKKVKDIKTKDYNPSRCTALYDAMGISITKLRSQISEGDTVVVTIVTDGLENASREYNNASIKSLVDEMKAQNWVLAYVGANQDVMEVGASISITNCMSFSCSDSGVKKMSGQLSSARTRLFDRISKGIFCCEEANSDFFDNEL